MIPDGSHLCLECGLCCNGVIFADVQLQPGDDMKRLALLGLVPAGRRGKADVPGAKSKIQRLKFAQPCAALGGDCRCHIYPDRPKYCREFECLLLKSVLTGKTESPAALGIIRTARRRVEKVKRLLRELDDTDEHVALSIRFRRMQKRLEEMAPDEKTADLFGQLTLAVQNLNLLLSDAFYAGPNGSG